MTLLDVQHIKKIYKTRFQGTQVEALKDIHFTVEKGEYVAIMGESGSGKSTLLNILAMLNQTNEDGSTSMAPTPQPSRTKTHRASVDEKRRFRLSRLQPT